jgi:hypothetical protein
MRNGLCRVRDAHGTCIGRGGTSVTEGLNEDVLDEGQLREDIGTVLQLIQTYDDVRASVGPVLRGSVQQSTGTGGNVVWLWSESGAFSPQMFGPSVTDELTAEILEFLEGLPGHPTI